MRWTLERPKAKSEAGMHDSREIDDVREYFASRGFGLAFVEDHGTVWCGLTRLSSGRLVAPKYGSGTSTVTAALRARERYVQEEEPES